jgi:hypothetical protein
MKSGNLVYSMARAILTVVAIVAASRFSLSKQAITAHTDGVSGDFHRK